MFFLCRKVEIKAKSQTIILNTTTNVGFWHSTGTCLATQSILNGAYSQTYRLIPPHAGGMRAPL